MRKHIPAAGTVLTFVAASLPCTFAPCQSEAAAVVTKPSKQGTKGPALAEWPSNMLLAGAEGQPCLVPMGTTAERAIEWAHLFFPYNEKLALKALNHTRSELGETEMTTPAFYLSRFAVTNEQYHRFVKATGHRFPFHWWRHGATANFEEHRTKSYKAFPELEPGDRGNAPLYYWEDFWKSEKLEYAIPAGEEKHPVVFVSWKDALQFAAWAGMRLPTEVEWTFAANGGQRKAFVFGDEWDPGILKQLRMDDLRDIKLKPVGALGPKAIGPFGHGDMVGQVWEWVAPLGYGAQTSQKLFEDEYKRLRREKTLGKRLAEAADFKSEFAIAKGGSYFSFHNKDFVQARINCRAPLATMQTLAGLGFRVAKTRRPAYDMSLSRLQVDYPSSFLSENKEPSLENQIGFERYDLEGGGEIIANYHAVSLIPINYLTLKKNERLQQIREISKQRPYELAVLITTETLTQPALEPGVYVVYLRRAGITQDLKDALSIGHKTLVALDRAKKRAAKSGKDEPAKEKEPEEAEPDTKKQNGKPKKLRWDQVLRSYGYSNEEVLANSPTDLAKYVYLRQTGNPKKGEEWFKISTEKNQLIFRDRGGKWMTSIDTKVDFAGIISTDPEPAITDPVNGRLSITFTVPVDQAQAKKTSRQRAMQFKLDLQMK